MSIKIMTEVWHSAPVEQGALLVLLALADSADDSTRTCYPGIAAIASKCRLSERQAQYCIKRLREQGVIEVKRNASPVKTNLYVIAHESTWETGRDAITAPPPEKPETQLLQVRDATHCVSDTQPIAPKPSVTSVETLDSRPSLFPDREKQESKDTSFDTAFEQWWKVFPRRVGSKAKVKSAFKTALKKVSFDDLVRATKAYAEAMEDSDQKFIKYPQGWLNDERWTEHLSQGQTGTRNPDDPFEGLPPAIRDIIKFELDPDERRRQAEGYWARQEAGK